jgi:hypothetical protein
LVSPYLTPERIPENHAERLHQSVKNAWQIFLSQFLGEKYQIVKEAPFQHHFANIISAIGNLYCLSRDDRFFVDLEKKCENIRNKTKYTHGYDIFILLLSWFRFKNPEIKIKTEHYTKIDHWHNDPLYIPCAANQH